MPGESDDFERLREILRAVTFKAGGSVELTAADFREADRYHLDVTPGRDGETDKLYVRTWGRRPDATKPS